MPDLIALCDHYRQEAANKRATLEACEAALPTATRDERVSLSIRADRARGLLRQCAAVLDLLEQHPKTALNTATLAAVRYRMRADFWEDARRRIAEPMKRETEPERRRERCSKPLTYSKP